MSRAIRQRVGIIGAGASGLVSTKNLVEEGFKVTTFERNEHLGGMWHFNKDPNQTTCLKETVSNISKQGMCFSDLPFKDGSVAGVHPTSKEIEDYLEQYADTFDLRRHIRFATTVTGVRRLDASNQWQILTQPSGDPGAAVETHTFDRIIISTGPHTKAILPKLKDTHLFRGELIHFRAFKEPSKYAGKTVVVLGFNASAADIVETLRLAGAKKLYISHRRSIRLIPRMYQGKAIDHSLTRRIGFMFEFFRKYVPWFYAWFLATFIGKMQNDTWPNLLKHAAWGPDYPLPQPLSSIPNVSDNIFANLESGAVESVKAVEGFTGPRDVLLADGTVLHDVDSVICATGSVFDFSALLPPQADPTNPAHAPEQFKEIQSQPYYSDNQPWVRLYRNFLSREYPDSLAFVGLVIFRGGAFPLYDLISLAIAQLWSGKYPMPMPSEMDADIEAHRRYLLGELKKGYVAHMTFSHSMELDQWLNSAAGTGIYENTGWGYDGWKLMWQDYPLFQMVQGGMNSPHMLRLFETGRRKAWPGARAAMEKANQEVAELGAAWKAEQQKKKGKEKTV